MKNKNDYTKFFFSEIPMIIFVFFLFPILLPGLQNQLHIKIVSANQDVYPPATPEQYFQTSPNDMGVLISGYTGGGAGITDLVIPQTINGQIVTRINDEVFRAKGLTSVRIPDTVYHIGFNAFRNNSLSEITLPASLVNLYRNAFYENNIVISDIGDFTYLLTTKGVVIINYLGTSTNLILPIQIEGFPVIGIGDEAFISKNLSAITFPETLRFIGGRSFRYNNLSSLSFPDSLIGFGKSAFRDNNITTISFSENSSLKIIDNSSFRDNELISVNIPKGVYYIGNHAFYRNNLETITFPTVDFIIGDTTFAENSLPFLILPNNISSIGSDSFLSNKLVLIDLPEKLTSIGTKAFQYNLIRTIIIRNENLVFNPTIFNYNYWGSSSEMTIIGKRNSTAFDYSQTNDFNFIELQDSPYIYSYPPSLEFENYRIGLANASVILKNPFDVSIDDSTFQKNQWKLTITLEHLNNGIKQLVNPTLSSSFSDLKVFNGGPLKEKTTDNVTNEGFSFGEDGPFNFNTQKNVLFLNAPPLVFYHNFYLEFPSNSFNLFFSNTSQKGSYSGIVTFEMTISP